LEVENLCFAIRRGRGLSHVFIYQLTVMIFFKLRLPKGEIREAWIKFLKKYNPLLMSTSLSTSVCGLHFKTDLDYEVTPSSVYQTKRLKKNAVPSIMHKSKLFVSVLNIQELK